MPLHMQLGHFLETQKVTHATRLVKQQGQSLENRCQAADIMTWRCKANRAVMDNGLTSKSLPAWLLFSDADPSLLFYRG